MKGLIKTSILAGLLCFAFSAQAQVDVKVGVKVGFNASNLSSADDLSVDVYDWNGDLLYNYEAKYKLGFHLGVMTQLGITESFFVQPELLFSNQGMKHKWGNESSIFNLNYLQLPIYAGYKVGVGEGLDVLLAAGPYLAYGVYGTNDPFEEDAMGFKLNRFDFGLSFMGGIEFNKFQITVGYDLGLTDIITGDAWQQAKDHNNVSSIKNSNIKVSVGYFF